jgi:hypothetical protein
MSKNFEPARQLGRFSFRECAAREMSNARSRKLSEFKRDLAEEVFRRTRRVRRSDSPPRA